MTALAGGVLGVGLLLVASPLLWPDRGRSRLSRVGSRVAARIRDRMMQAGLPTDSVSLLIVISGVFAIAAAALVYAIVPVDALSVVGGVSAGLLPFALLSARARQREKANPLVWPDTVDHLVSAVRSGLSLPDSLISLVRNASAGAGSTADNTSANGSSVRRKAFAAFEVDYRASGNFDDCLDRLKERLADPVADRILEILRMSREVGGSDLVAVLRSLSAYLRQEAAIRAEIQSRQGWVMNAARLGVTAPWIILLLLTSRPEAAGAYNTAAGFVLIMTGLIVSVLAYRLMVAIGRIPEESRWFQ